MMKHIITFVLTGLVVVAGIWPVRGTTQDLVNVDQYRDARFHQGRVIVKYRGERHIRRVWLGAGETVLGKLRAMIKNPRIEYAEPDFLITIDKVPNDPSTSELWGMGSVRAYQAWDMTTGSQEVVIAVTDTGVDYRHPDLASNMWRNPGEVPSNGVDDDRNGHIDDYYGWNAHAGNGNPLDDNDHGTHVAGTIGAVGNNSIGVAGVNWRASIMALKFLDANGSGTLSDAIETIDYAIMMKQRGVNIAAINASWGSTSFSMALRDAVDRATQSGILFVAAAGNEGRSQRSYPGGYDNALAVAALDQDDKNLASFSNYGSWVDVAAPGVSILSTITGNKYARFSGTSMATPHVAGLAGLMASVAPYSVSEMRQAIRAGVRVLPTLKGMVATSGTIDAAETLNRLGTEPPPGGGTPPGDNRPPTVKLSASATSVTAGTPVTITAQAGDPENDPMTFEWQASAGTLSGQGNAVTLDTSKIKSASGAPVAVSVGVVVKDGRGGQASNQIFVIVKQTTTKPAKFSLKIEPTEVSLERGPALVSIQVIGDEGYSIGNIRLEPIILNNADEIFVMATWRRPWGRRSTTSGMMYIALLTPTPTVSQYYIIVKGTDEFGGETYSEIVTATLP